MIYFPDDGLVPYELAQEIMAEFYPHELDIPQIMFDWIGEDKMEYKDGRLYRK